MELQIILIIASGVFVGAVMTIAFTHLLGMLIKKKNNKAKHQAKTEGDEYWKGKDGIKILRKGN